MEEEEKQKLNKLLKSDMEWQLGGQQEIKSISLRFSDQREPT